MIEELDPFALIVDEGGHRKTVVTEWVLEHRRQKRLFKTYKGDSRSTIDTLHGWKESKGDIHRLLVDARYYQGKLLAAIHSQNDHRAVDYWGMPKDFDDLYSAEYMRQVLSFRPGGKRVDGHLFANWSCGDRLHDYFDAEKMILALVAYVATRPNAAKIWSQRTGFDLPESLKKKNRRLSK